MWVNAKWLGIARSSVDTCDKQITTRPVCTMGDRRAPDADRDAFPADRWTELRLESSLSHRGPFVNPLGRVCPSVNPVNRQSPSALPFHSLLRNNRMHNQTAVSLMQIAVSIDRRQIADAREFTARRIYRVVVASQTAGYYFSRMNFLFNTAIYKPLYQLKIFYILSIVYKSYNPSYMTFILPVSFFMLLVLF